MVEEREEGVDGPVGEGLGVEVSLVRIYAYCFACHKEWETRNAMGIAARHARDYGHEVHVERTYTNIFNGE